MKTRNKDRILGLIVLVVAAVFAAMAMQLKAPNAGNEPGPRLFPLMACLLMALSGISLIVKKDDGKGKAYMTKEEWIRLFTIFGIYVLYLALLWLVGFRIAAFVVLFATSTLFAKGKQVSLVKRLIYSVAVTAAIYIIYVNVFRMLIPTGIVF